MLWLLAVVHLLILTESTTSLSPLPFLDIESRSSSNKFQICDDCTESVTLPTAVEFGNFSFNFTYISSNGLFSFGRSYTAYIPKRFPILEANVVAPFWDDQDLRLPTNGSLVYELLTRDNAASILDDVDTFISNHQSISFEADWILVAKWIDVCIYPSSSCGNNRTNTYQALIASQGLTSYAVFTYKCDLLRWTNNIASVGFSAGPHFFANHPLSKTRNVTDIDCVNYPDSATVWNNVIYKLHERVTCSPSCVNGVCIRDNVCFCNNGWNGTICDSFICEPECGRGNCIGPNTCRCHPGWTGPRCRTDINECNNDSICHHLCNNTQGSYDCYCQDGYMLSDDNYTCKDVDECSMGIDDCLELCINTNGSYYCSLCNEPGYGYNINYDNCSNINECNISNGGCDQKCIDTIGSYYCDCNDGYILSSNNQSCLDIDECKEGGDNCTMLEECYNIPGSYECRCIPGYSRTNGVCEDVDECQFGNDGCIQICVNIPGSYNCSCMDGYRLKDDGFDCEDIDECLLLMDDCEQTCDNTIGSYQCGCSPGFTLRVDGKTCELQMCSELLYSPLNGLLECTNVGIVENSTGLVTNNTCNVTCSRGYELVGSSHRTCLPDGTWSGQRADCVPLQCPTPVAPANGFIQLPCSRDYSTSCRVRCFIGYSIINGSDTITCDLPIDNNNTNSVSWNIPGTCEEIPVCTDTTCSNGGVCMESPDSIDGFECNCDGTLYIGKTCDRGLIQTTIVGNFRQFSTITLTFTAKPKSQINIKFSTVKGRDDCNKGGGDDLIGNGDCPLRLDSSNNNASTQLLLISSGLHTLYFSISGNDADNFNIPNPSLIPVQSNSPPSSVVNFTNLQPSCFRPNSSSLELCASFVSSCEWQKNGTSTTTAGIVHSKVDGVNFPISLLGLDIAGSDWSKATIFSDDATCNPEKINETCYRYKAKETDKIEFLKEQSLSVTFIKEVQMKLLPDWVTLAATDDDNVLNKVSETDHKVNIVTKDEVRDQAGCEFVLVDTEREFIVLQYDGPLRMNLQTSLDNYETINLAAPSIGSVYCVAVNLCNGRSSPVHFGIPLSSSMALNGLSFIDKYINRGWNFTFNSVNVQKSSRTISSDDIYWNNVIPDYKPHQIDANTIFNMNANASFSSGETSVKLTFSGDVYYQYNTTDDDDVKANEFIATGDWAVTMTTVINSTLEKIELSDRDTAASGGYIYHSSDGPGNHQCNSGEVQSGIAVKTFYKFRRGQPFYEKLLQLPFDTSKCPIDMFLSLDDNQNMNGLSLYSECIDISYNSLIFEMLSHKIYLPMTTICNEPTAFNQRYPDHDSFGLIIHSSLKLNTKSLPLGTGVGQYFTLLPGIDNTSVSMGFMKSSSDKVGLMHSVLINLLDSSFTVPITLTNNDLSFIGTSSLYGDDFYRASFIGRTDITDVSWDRMSLELSGYFPKQTGLFGHAIQEAINETINMRATEARGRKEGADNQLMKSTNDLNKITSQLESAKEEYRNNNITYNRALNDTRSANRSLIIAQAAVTNSQAVEVELSLNDVCMRMSCPPQCVTATRTRTVFKDQYITTTGTCPSPCTVPRLIRVSPFEVPSTEWRFLRCCFNKTVSCGDGCFKKECEYRFVCKSVPVMKPVFNYDTIYVNATCYIACNKTVYSDTIENTERFIDPCGLTIPEPNCTAANEMCDKERERNLNIIQRRRQDLAELVQRRNRARRDLNLAENRLSLAELMLKMTEDKLRALQGQFDLAERVLNASKVTSERVLSQIGSDIQLYELTKNYSTSEIIDITNITFAISLRGISPIRVPIDITFNTPLSQQLSSFTAVYDFNQLFDQQKTDLANSIIDRLISDDSGNSRRKRAEIEQSEIDFQTRCAQLASVDNFLQYLFNSLQDALKLSQKLTSETSDLLESIDDMTSSAQSVLPINANYVRLKSSFNITQEEIDNEPEVTLEDSVLSSILETFGDVRNSTDELLRNINRTVYEQWLKELSSLLLNDGSIADQSCYSFSDCLQVLTVAVENLLSFAPPRISSDLSANILSAANALISIASSDNLTITESLNRLSPMMSIVSAMNESGYWCASPPTFITHPVVEANVSVGDMLTLTCSGESALPLRYSWRKDGVLIPGADSSTLHVNDFRVFDEGNYTCHITNDVGTVQSTNASVHGYILPEFYLTPVPVLTYFGDENGALFTCNATSRPDPGWKWFFRPNNDSEWKEVIGEETNEILIIQPGPDDVGYYRCLVYNDHGNLSSNAAYLQLVSVTSRVFGSSVEFTMNVVTDNKRKKREESFEEVLLSRIQSAIELGSTTINDIRVDYISNGDIIQVILSLISANTTIGTLSLPEIVQEQLKDKSQLDNVLNEIRELLRKDSFNINTTSGVFEVNADSVRLITPEILCSNGQGLNGDNRYLCMDCLKGQHQNHVIEIRFDGDGRTITEMVPRCGSCPLNTYQDVIGGGDCIPCPANHITRSTGSQSINDCLDVCPPNTKSVNGYSPCERCPRQTYQPAIGQTSCIPCRSEQDDLMCVISPCEVEGNFRRCNDRRLLFYYDISQGSCLPIRNRMCSSNKNSFSTYTECINQCGCPDNTNVTTCVIDPCSTSTCPNYPNAQCVSDYCNNCTSRYYFNRMDVTNLCTCPASMELISCPGTCQRTCQNPQPTNCGVRGRCEPKCGCPEGTVLDEVTNLCIDEEECDTCSLSANRGPCHGTYPRWFFNSTSKRCEHFSYGGCNGNSNRFTSLQSCIDTCGCGDGSPLECSANPCQGSNCPSYPTAVCEVDKCTNSTCTARHYVAFDDVTDTCNICELDVSPGSCNNNITRWYYNNDLGRCAQFTYGGCEGNGNNFKTIQECVDTCDAKCSLGISKVQCLSDACQSSSCVSHPEASCVTRSCGQCTAHYYSPTGIDVTPMCNECPPDQPPVTCLIDYCKYQKCLQYTQADCIVDKCGSCVPRYFINGTTEVTNQCSYCPVEGEIFKECILSCRLTCSNIIMDRPLICNASCSPGCECPAGQVLDELAMKCVYPEDCSCPPCEPVSPNCTNIITPDNHICSCPICADCPVKGQQYKSSGAGCPHTCTTHNDNLLCTGSDNPGCSCPEGQVIDEEINECVNILECPEPDPCTLRVDRGPCSYLIPRYFHNTTSSKCERFEYGGCFGNENNFFSLYDCEEKCSLCPPMCSPEFCSVRRNAICTLKQSSSTCPSGSCELSNCLACYYSYNTLPLPSGAGDCSNDCTKDGQLVQSCVSAWGVCIRKAYLNTYNQVQFHERIEDNFRCWKFSCQ